jgi:hypothetical protein
MKEMLPMEHNHVVLTLESYHELLRKIDSAQKEVQRLKDGFTLDKDYAGRPVLCMDSKIAADIATDLVRNDKDLNGVYNVEEDSYDGKVEIDKYRIKFVMATTEVEAEPTEETIL